MSAKETKNVVASVLARLRNASKSSGAPFQQVLQQYAIERFLFRISRSKHAQSVVLKGALLLKTIGIPRARPTIDIDMLRTGKADQTTLAALIRDCATLDVEPDGLTFLADSVVAEEITKDSEYQGTRILMDARMENVRLRVQIDFGVGDVMVPGPRMIEYPVFLDGDAIKLLAYPVESTIAEKLQAMVALGSANSRMKDFYDVWTKRFREEDGGGWAHRRARPSCRGSEELRDAGTPLDLARREVRAGLEGWKGMGRLVTSDDTIKWPLRDALRAAQALLDEELGLIEGSIALAAYAHDVVPDWRVDPDFVVFGALASETDHLPIGQARSRWSVDALARADAEIEAIEARSRAQVRQAGENVIRLFTSGRRTTRPAAASLKGCSGFLALVSIVVPTRGAFFDSR